MTKADDPTKSNSFEQLKPEASRALIESGIKQASKLNIWTQDQSATLQTRVLTTVDSKVGFFLSVPIEEKEVLFLKILENANQTECMFTYYLPDDILFFKGQTKKQDDKGIFFKIREPIFKVQRRSNFRLKINDNLPATFQMPGGSVEKIPAKVLDVSSGGIGLFVQDKKFIEAIEAVTEVSKITFSVSGRSFVLDGFVRYKTPVTKTTNSGIKLGIEFKKVPGADESFLTGYVFDQCIKQFKK